MDIALSVWGRSDGFEWLLSMDSRIRGPVLEETIRQPTMICGCVLMMVRISNAFFICCIACDASGEAVWYRGSFSSVRG